MVKDTIRNAIQDFKLRDFKKQLFWDFLNAIASLSKSSYDKPVNKYFRGAIQFERY